MSENWKQLIAEGRHQELGALLTRMAGMAATIHVMEDVGIRREEVLTDETDPKELNQDMEQDGKSRSE